MNREFIPYEQALELIKLGFDEECLGWYPKDTAALSLYNVFIGKPSLGSYKLLAFAPLYQQAFRWFRDNHGLHHEIKKEKGINDSTNIFFVPITQSGLKKKLTHTPQHTYEEAELACLKKLIEIVKS